MGSCLCRNSNDSIRQGSDLVVRSNRGSPDRRVEVSQTDMVIDRYKIKLDRLETRVKEIEKEEVWITKEIDTMIKEKKKEEAFFHVEQLKKTKGFKRKAQDQILIIEKQLRDLEHREDDQRFKNAVKSSNELLEKLNREIEMDEVLIAKELHRKGKMRKEELNELLTDGEDRELREQVEKIEARIRN